MQRQRIDFLAPDRSFPNQVPDLPVDASVQPARGEIGTHPHLLSSPATIPANSDLLASVSYWFAPRDAEFRNQNDRRRAAHRDEGRGETNQHRPPPAFLCRIDRPDPPLHDAVGPRTD